MQRDRKYSKYIHVLLYLKDKGNIWAPIRLKKRKKNREKLNNVLPSKWKQTMILQNNSTPEKKICNDILYSRKDN